MANPKNHKRQTISSLAGLGAALHQTQPAAHDQEQPQQEMHNPNPFDFVPFSDAPSLYGIDELKGLGSLMSGWLEINLKAWTPVHIVGRQEPDPSSWGQKISRSHFYKQNGIRCIPASSIRGTLRSFIEALTNGWVSKINDKYEKYFGIEEKGGKKRLSSKCRHIGFRAFDAYENKHSASLTNSWHIAPAIPPSYRPTSNGKMDIATFLFGAVFEGEDDNSKQGRVGRVRIEDALLRGDSLIEHVQLPDIKGDAFMGSPNPRASSWWYMKPKEVWERKPKKRDLKNDASKIIGEHHVAEFVGEGYWGRKFYFHQDYEKCIQWYDDPERGWVKLHPKERKQNGQTIVEYPLQGKYYKYDVEALKTGGQCTFRLYVDRLPRNLLYLLLHCLCPTGNIRHKLGYGKPFGLGSVEFSIKQAMLREEKQSGWPDELKPQGFDRELAKGWSNEAFANFVDQQALASLGCICGWQPDEHIIFTYPPFNHPNFATPTQFADFAAKRTAAGLGHTGFKTPVTEAEAKDLAKCLSSIKTTIHLGVYQESSNGWATIAARTP